MTTTTILHRAREAILVMLFWGLAAALVTVVQAMLDTFSTLFAALLTFAAIFVAAYAYSHLCARQAGITHALGVGIAWLLLTIVAEIALSTCIGHDWYALLGTPDRPLLRNVYLFAWIFAPAMTT